MPPDARTLIENLLGQTIYTLGRDKPNVVKAVDGDNVIVGTRRSPGGKPVPLSLVQMGLDNLHEAGNLRISPETFNGRRRSSFIGAAIATLPDVAVEHRPVIRLLLAGSHPEVATGSVTSAGDGYPDPQTARSVDDAGVKVAIRAISERYPGARIIEMPHNNPGFDVIALLDSGGAEYIEIKSTSGSAPSFFLTEKERVFAAEHSGQHHLVVVMNVNVDAVTGDVRWHDGPLVEPLVHLAPQQWKGMLS